MDRRSFLRAGAALGVVSLTGQSRVGARPEPGGEQTLWLCWNENPLGLSPRVDLGARQALELAHRYPDRARASLAVRIAESNGVRPENVVLGCGSTQILQGIVLSEAATAKTLVLAEPTFEAMARYQRPFTGGVEKVSLDSRHAHDIGRMRERVGERPALVYLCNPNNPTATLTPSREMDAWIRAAPEEVVFAVDEAYHEYVESTEYRSAVEWIESRPNVVVTRTFSKIYAMAGLRLGYAICQAQTARRLRQYISADNANGVALAAAEASLRDADLIRRSRLVNRRSRQIVVGCLQELGLDHLPSHANFLMHEIRGSQATYIERMREAGIRVGRPFPPLEGYNRLSLGLPEEMERWAETLKSFRAKGYI